ncbi:MAG: STAS domain-containing protein [Anaerococcus sp.]|nr:STAS domain-containing protein [Anaerococcus sp.]
MFKANVEEKDNQILVNLQGDLDVYSEDEFRDFIEENLTSKQKDVLIDLKDLDYLDSTGLGMFMKIYNDKKKADKSVRIINPKDNILKLFKITDLTGLFKMVEDGKN